MAETLIALAVVIVVGTIFDFWLLIAKTILLYRLIGKNKADEERIAKILR